MQRFTPLGKSEHSPHPVKQARLNDVRIYKPDANGELKYIKTIQAPTMVFKKGRHWVPDNV